MPVESYALLSPETAQAWQPSMSNSLFEYTSDMGGWGREAPPTRFEAERSSDLDFGHFSMCDAWWDRRFRLSIRRSEQSSD